MTSRTTPVGILIIALAGLIAVGCSAPTSAVFQALLDPAGTTVSTPEASPADSAAQGSETSTWWPEPEGYELVLPAGWSGMVVHGSQTDDLVDAADLAVPGLGAHMEDVIGGSDIRVSAVATDALVPGKVAPAMVVLTEPKAGRKYVAVKTDVLNRINSLPGLRVAPSPHLVRLPNDEGVRYDYTIDDPTMPELGELRVRSWLFRVGGKVYLVNFVVSADLAADAAADFDEIQNSLRFGV